MPGIVSATGGPVRRLADDTNSWERPVWSPDGKSILTQVQQYDPDQTPAARSSGRKTFRTIDVRRGR